MSRAAKRLGLHPMTLRQWAVDGKIPFFWVGRERRFSSVDVENMKRGSDSATSRPRLELLYVRVSGLSGQESSLAAQEEELRATSTGTVVKVVKDRGSGLRENRPGLNRVLAMVCDDSVTVVRDPACVRPPVEPQRCPGPGCRTVDGRSGYRRLGNRNPRRRPPLDGGQGHGPHDEHPHVPDGARADR